MNNIQRRRLYYICLMAIGLSLSSGLVFYALKKNLNVFVTPSQLMLSSYPADYHFRLGGLVKQNSLVHEKKGLGVQFIMTDLKKDIPVRYTGVLPDLFREGKGAVAEGRLMSQGYFLASFILAKHDENYMPKKVYQAMRQSS